MTPLRSLGKRTRLLVPAFVVLVGLVCVLIAYRYRTPSSAPPSQTADGGRASDGPSAAHAPSSPAEDELERLRALGYLAGYDEARNEPVGVVHRASEGVQPGLNLYVSAHAPEAFLMTLDGETLHRWQSTFAEVCPAADPEGSIQDP